MSAPDQTVSPQKKKYHPSSYEIRLVSSDEIKRMASADIQIRFWCLEHIDLNAVAPEKRNLVMAQKYELQMEWSRRVQYQKILQQKKEQHEKMMQEQELQRKKREEERNSVYTPQNVPYLDVEKDKADLQLQKNFEDSIYCNKYMERKKTPVDMKVDLLLHQEIALSWFEDLETNKKGGILADDMGLGKTIVSISHLCSKYPFEKNSPAVVIVPLGIINQWLSEIKLLCDKPWRVLIYHGSRNREEDYLKEFDIIITSIGTVVSDYKKGINPVGLFKIKISRLILDEGHLIRNRGTMSAQACFRLSDNATFRFVLTGTPVHNKLEDLYSLLRFIGAETDFKNFKKVEEKGISKVHEVYLQDHLLRRNKYHKLFGKPILELPEKESNNFYFDLTKDEMIIYKKLVEMTKPILNELEVGGAYAQSRGAYAKAISLLMRMRQLCNHSMMVAHLVKEEKKKTENNKLLQGEFCDICKEVIDENEKIWTKCNLNGHNFCIGCLSKAITEKGEKCPVCKANINWKELRTSIKPFSSKTFKHSSKTKHIFQVMIKILRQTDDKILIVSCFTQFLDIIQIPLEKISSKHKFRNRLFEFCRIDGSMTLDEKKFSLQKMKSSNKARVMLVSLNACGLGLNLTFANHLFLVDAWWNPQTEKQAVDRIYRIGQTKKCYIYRLSSKGTIEQHILSVRLKKQKAAADLFEEQSEEENRMDIGELKSIFKSILDET